MQLCSAPIAVIDLETTGLDLSARIIEVAVVHLDPGQLPRVAFASRVNPEAEIPEKVTRITGISGADVADAPTWAEVAPLVLAALEGRDIAAYNVPADLRWLQNECARVGLVAAVDLPWLDVYVLARSEHCDKYARGGKRLLDVARRRGIAVDAHGAAGDAVTTALLLPLLAHEAAVWTREIDEVLDDMVSMALERERDFIAYLIRQGATGDRPDCPWHDMLGMEPPGWPEPRQRVGRCMRCATPATYHVAKDGTVTLYAGDEPHVCMPPGSDGGVPYMDETLPF